MEFKATPMSIDDTLKLKRKYVIPRFQREYSWDTDELLTIWEDLLDSIICKENTLLPQEYFLGSLVLVGDDDSANIERYIVDGQQRLMTFTIAFSALTQAFLKADDKKLARATFQNVIAVDNDGNEYSKLLAEMPKPYFQYRIQQMQPEINRAPQNEEENRILKAMIFFENHFDKSSLIKEMNSRFTNISENVTYVDLLKAFRDQMLACKVVYVMVKNFEDAYTIFEVLNAKGKDLTAVDIIKNSIFSVLKIEEPIDIATEKWKSARDNISGCGEDFPTFYRHYWLSKYSFSTAKRLVKDFKNNIDRTETAYNEFLLSLEEESKYYAQIISPKQDQWKQPEHICVYSILLSLNVFGTSQVRSFLLSLFKTRNEGLVSHKIFIKVLNFLEYFHFVFTAVCSSRASGLERRYSSYARRLRKCHTKQEVAKTIDELISILKESIPPYTVFEHNFLKIQFTSEKTQRKSLVQFILKKCEQFYAGTDELAPLSFTIEHIVPESTKADYVGLIGNLLPLGEELNSKLSNKDFALKLQRYTKSNYSSVQEFIKTCTGSETFDKNEIELRSKKLCSLLYYDVWKV